MTQTAFLQTAETGVNFPCQIWAKYPNEDIYKGQVILTMLYQPLGIT